jgi:hypothetical protein
LGIRTDGSLWAAGNIPRKVFGEKAGRGKQLEGVRIGTKSDWVALSGDWQQTALEANGTLWTMQFDYTDQIRQPSKYTDWLAATEYGLWTWALAKDGTLTGWDQFEIDWPDYRTPFMQRFFLGPSRRPIFSVNILDKQQ